MRTTGETLGQPEAQVAFVVPTSAEVYRDHAEFLWRVLRRLGVRPADVEDVCHDLFLVVHRKLPEFRHHASIRTWLYSIAVRCASDYRRRAHITRETSDIELVETPVEASQLQSVADREARAVLDEILHSLDGAKREVFVLYELEELAMVDVAEAVGCPIQTAYSRLHAAREEFEAAVKRRQAKERI